MPNKSSSATSRTMSKSKSTKSNKRSITSPAIVPEEGQEAQIAAINKGQDKRLKEMYKNQQEMEAMVKIDNLIEGFTLGRGIVSLVDKELKELLGIEGPYLETQVFNSRDAEEKQVKTLWAKTGRGENLQPLAMEHEVIIGVHKKEDVKEDWSKKWDKVVVWSDEAKNGSAILINGNHRLQLVKTFLMEQGLRDLKICLKAGRTKDADELKKELKLKAEWTAKVIDLEQINQMQDQNAKLEVLSRLSKNNDFHRKADSVIERISNLGPFLLANNPPTTSEIDKRLQLEGKEITDTNKSSKGILQDIQLVQGICHITQFDYFRKTGQLKVKELNESRSFACPMIMPLVTIGAKFYTSLTSPAPAQAYDSKNDLYKFLDTVQMFDPALQPKILDDTFFSGLDALFVEHLFPSFQAFGLNNSDLSAYDQNNAPCLNDDNEDEQEKEDSKEMISLHWIKEYKNKYIPAVGKFVAEWVTERKKVLCMQVEVQILDALQQKVLQFLTIGEGRRAAISSVPWHTDKMAVPLVTPSLISSLTSELNAVEDAAVSLLMLLEPTAWVKIKVSRGQNALTVKQVLEIWAKRLVMDKTKGHQLTRRLLRILLSERHIGLACLGKYLRENKFVPKLKKFHTKHNGTGGIDIPDLDKWSSDDLDILELNNLMAKLQQLQAQQGQPLVLENRHFKEYLDQSQDKDRAHAIIAMMKGSYVLWGSFTPKLFAKVGAQQTKELLQSYERAKHIWEGIAQNTEVKHLWEQFQNIVINNDGVVWVEKAKWELSPDKEIILAEDESLAYLAPLQKNMAVEAKEKQQKNLVDKMNRIMMDTLSIAAVSLDGDDMVIPEEVMDPLKQLLQQLGYCALNKISCFESKQKLKELDSLTMPEIQDQLNTQGLHSDVLDMEVVSRRAWKQSLSLPKGKDFNRAILKRAGITLEKNKGIKRPKRADENPEEENSDVDMEEVSIEKEPNTGEEINMQEKANTEEELQTAENANTEEEINMEEEINSSNVEGQSKNTEESVGPLHNPDIEMGNDVVSQGEDPEREDTPEPPTCGQPKQKQTHFVTALDLTYPPELDDMDFEPSP